VAFLPDSVDDRRASGEIMTSDRVGTKTLTELAQDFEVRPNQIRDWKAQAGRRGRGFRRRRLERADSDSGFEGAPHQDRRIGAGE
jgi:transposase-like protein